jgi:hypothetical protein
MLTGSIPTLRCPRTSADGRRSLHRFFVRLVL